MRAFAAAKLAPDSVSKPHSPARARLVLAAKFALAALLVVWLVRSGRFAPRALLEVRSLWALCGVALCQTVMVLGQSLRWKIVLGACGLEISSRAALRVGLAGQFASVWTPAGIGLDGARILDGARRFPTHRAAVLKAAALDRVCAVAALAVLCVPALLWLSEYGRIRPYSAILAAILVAFALWKWRAIACSFALSTLVQCANIGALACAFRALGRAVSPEGIGFAAPLVVLSSLVPLTPLGIGVVDGAAAELFARAAMTGGAETVMLARASWILASLVCGGVGACLRERGTVEFE